MERQVDQELIIKVPTIVFNWQPLVINRLFRFVRYMRDPAYEHERATNELLQTLKTRRARYANPNAAEEAGTDDVRV